jgi:hypothetical protein
MVNRIVVNTTHWDKCNFVCMRLEKQRRVSETLLHLHVFNKVILKSLKQINAAAESRASTSTALCSSSPALLQQQIPGYLMHVIFSMSPSSVTKDAMQLESDQLSAKLLMASATVIATALRAGTCLAHSKCV